MTLLQRVIEAALEMTGDEVYVYPVREVEYEEPRYQNWWKGWFNFGWWPKWEGGVPRPVHVGPRLRDFSMEGANPANTRWRDVEEHPVRAAVEPTPDGFTVAGGRVSWKRLPPGRYTKIRVRHLSGELLWESRLSRPFYVEDNCTVTLVSADLQLSIPA